MEQLYPLILQLFPEGVDPAALFSAYAFIGIAIVVIGGAARIIKGKGSDFSHSLSSAVAILTVYTCFGILYRLDPKVMEPIIELLPMVTLKDGVVYLFDFAKATPSVICAEVLHLFILVFLEILLDDLIPDAKNILSWFVLQFTIAAFSTLGYWFIIHTIESYIPELLTSFAPLVLVSILVFMMMLAILKVILGVMLTAINPLFGAVYTFFFASKFGKTISKSFLSTLLLCALIGFIEFLGHVSFAIIGGTLLPFLLFLGLLLVLWYLLGYIF